jgi:hypothetical protein
MKRVSGGGIGALAFLALVIAGMVVASPPGGTYKASDVAKYLERGHRPAVIVAFYLIAVAAVGLLFLLRRLRDALDGSRATVFWGLSVAGGAAIVVGFGLVAAVPIAMGVGGKGVVIAPTVAFTIIETGWAVLAGAGFTLVGLALLTLTLGPSALPGWVRWTTLVGGLAFAAGMAWFPLPLVGIWLLVMGIWLVRTERSEAPETQAAVMT